MPLCCFAQTAYLEPARILMLGLDDAGKTTILYKIKVKKLVTTVPTIGFNVETIQVKDGVEFTVWDVGGQTMLRSTWNHYYENTDGLIFVIDSSNRESLQEAKKELLSVLQNPQLKSVPLVIMANKQDIPGAVHSSELGKLLSLKETITDRKWHLQPCSAVNNHGITKALGKLNDMIRANKT